MRQVGIPRYGAPDVLETRQAPDPSPSDDEIRIRVRAAGINFADILARLGLYPDAPKPPTGTRVTNRIGFVVATGAARAVAANAKRTRTVARARRYRDADGTASTLTGARPLVANEEAAARTGRGWEDGAEAQDVHSTALRSVCSEASYASCRQSQEHEPAECRSIVRRISRIRALV